MVVVVVVGPLMDGKVSDDGLAELVFRVCVHMSRTLILLRDDEAQ